jgi:transposase
MTLGRAPTQESLHSSTREFCESQLGERSIYRVLAQQSHRLFGDDLFADLYVNNGRKSVSPRILAVVMTLQRLEGLSDREAADRFTYDLRWKYAAGCLDYAFPGFKHTVLVNMRARLRASEAPNRIFERMLEIAREAGLVGRKRVLDSTALYDAVTTQDTVTMVRGAIVALLRTVRAEEPAELESELRALFKRDDDYAKSGKPACEWDDDEAREALIDALSRDAYAALFHLHDVQLMPATLEAAGLLATVVGQDIEEAADGRFRIIRGVAKDRTISLVDPEARHGHKTAARGFDGYKGHLAIDPDSEIITATTTTAGNVGDGAVAEELLKDVLPQTSAQEPTNEGEATTAGASTEPAASGAEPSEAKLEVYGDASYGLAPLIEKVEAAGGDAMLKVQGAHNTKGRFSKDDFVINLDDKTVTCPAGQLVQIRLRADGAGVAVFAPHCGECPLRAKCTESPNGRAVNIHKHERLLQRERTKQRDSAWKQRYRATRPKVERKLAHAMRRRHGGRRARVRGNERVGQDFAMLAAALNLSRLAALGVFERGVGV